MSGTLILNNSGWITLPLAILFGSCAVSPSDENQASACSKYMQNLQQVNAEDKASADWLSDNKGFMGVYGYSSEFPALDKLEPAVRQELLTSFGFEMVEGTTDEVLDEGCSKFDTEARQYVERYNLKKLEFTSKGGPSR